MRKKNERTHDALHTLCGNGLSVPAPEGEVRRVGIPSRNHQRREREQRLTHVFLELNAQHTVHSEQLGIHETPRLWHGAVVLGRPFWELCEEGRNAGMSGREDAVCADAGRDLSQGRGEVLLIFWSKQHA